LRRAEAEFAGDRRKRRAEQREIHRVKPTIKKFLCQPEKGSRSSRVTSCADLF
jgi:hypothetical protein